MRVSEYVCVSNQLEFEESAVTQLSALNSQEIVHLPVTHLPFVVDHYNQPVLNQYLQTWDFSSRPVFAECKNIQEKVCRVLMLFTVETCEIIVKHTVLFNYVLLVQCIISWECSYVTAILRRKSKSEQRTGN